MTYDTWQAIAETPWYTYVFYIYFVYIAYLTTKPRTMPLKSMIMLPFIIIPLTLINIYSAKIISTTTMTYWSFGLCAGIPFGWMHFRLLKVHAIKHPYRIYIPGSWIVFIMVLGFLSTIYYCANRFGVNPATILRGSHASTILIWYGLFGGLFIGRLIYSLRCLKAGPYREEAVAK